MSNNQLSTSDVQKIFQETMPRQFGKTQKRMQRNATRDAGTKKYYQNKARAISLPTHNAQQMKNVAAAQAREQFQPMMKHLQKQITQRATQLYLKMEAEKKAHNDYVRKASEIGTFNATNKRYQVFGVQRPGPNVRARNPQMIGRMRNSTRSAWGSTKTSARGMLGGLFGGSRIRRQ